MGPHDTRLGSPAIRGIALASCLVLAAGSTVAAQQLAKTEAAAPEPLIRETVDKVFKILRDPALQQDSKQRMLKLREAVDRAFDWDGMAQSSLGPPWRKLDDKQRAEFVSVFKELLAQQYMDDIDRFQGTEQVQIKGTEKSGELQTVKTILVTSSREQVPMNYTLQNNGKRWAVVDLSIEGVSLVNHYRQTFSRFLANKQFPELLQQLKRKLGVHD
jgi:phospholipid transport system substrate-binding protein